MGLNVATVQCSSGELWVLYGSIHVDVLRPINLTQILFQTKNPPLYQQDVMHSHLSGTCYVTF